MEKRQKTQIKIDRYQLLRSLGKGGMGEVFLAYDPVCERDVALKKILPHLKEKKTIQRRFLREAKVASQLTHPSIVPIYTIHPDLPDIFYTMPYVEGKTLRELLKTAKEKQQQREVFQSFAYSIPALSRIFLHVCEAMAYAHAKKIIHRDLKPENIIVGKYGEVLLLDWGIASFIWEKEGEDPVETEESQLTLPGKIAGTVAYMAPERLKGDPSSRLTDIYALGVIFYQILTLHLPFRRSSLAHFKKTQSTETLIDPEEMAPYRDIPPQLSSIAKKCLEADPKKRYQTIEEILSDLKNYIEGTPEWISMKTLHVEEKQDWEFQENVLLAKHIAITRSTDVMEWVNIMISKENFPGNIKLSADVQLKQGGHGIGFLLSIPEAGKRKNIEEGYCVWIGIKNSLYCRLFRSNVLVMEVTDLPIQPKNSYSVEIEKIDNHLRLSIDQKLILTYSSHIPLVGTHVGLLYKDGYTDVKQFEVYSGSHNLMVNCLVVPDAFFTRKDYDTALHEYRRIGHSFPGRAEGREALFRAGITLLEKAKSAKTEKEKNDFFQQAHEEFEKLHFTAGAPLEYLGKSLIHAALEDPEEEAKYLELALRKFAKHPLLPILEEHIIFRMHASSDQNRQAAYRLILIVLRHIPSALDNPDTKRLLQSLKKHMEPLPFIEAAKDSFLHLAIQLAFWIGEKEKLLEMIEKLLTKTPLLTIEIENILFSLLELGYIKEIPPLLKTAKHRYPPKDLGLSLIEAALEKDLKKGWEKFFSCSSKSFSRKEARVFLYLLQKTINQKNYTLAEKALQKIVGYEIAKEDRFFIDGEKIWLALFQKKYEGLFKKIPQEVFSDETTPYHFPYGCYLFLSSGSKTAFAHFSSVLDSSFPSTTALPSHFLTGRIDWEKGWIENSFPWEKKQLYRQITLYYRVIGDEEKENLYKGFL